MWIIYTIGGAVAVFVIALVVAANVVFHNVPTEDDEKH